MSKHLKSFSILLCAAFISVSQTKTYSYVSSGNDSLKITQLVLDNGLTVVLSEDHCQPTVFGSTIVKVGSKNDPADASGMAHSLEHLLFKGTEEMSTTNWSMEKVHIDSIGLLYNQLGKSQTPEEREKIQLLINAQSLKANQYTIRDEFSSLVRSIGGTNLNACTNEDATMFINSFPPNQMERWLDLYSQRFIKPVFREFQSEMEIICEEYNKELDIMGAQIQKEFSKNFFKNHPYGQHTVLGSIEYLKNPSLTKMNDFFKTYYVANNMVLLIVGDFNTEEVIPMIKEKFGRLPKGDLPVFPEYKEEPFNGRQLVKLNNCVGNVAVLGYRTVASGHQDELIVKLCSKMLSNESNIGMLDKLVLDDKLQEIVMSDQNFNDYGMNMFVVIPKLKLIDLKLDSTEKLVVGEIAKLAKGEFPDYMLDAIKKNMLVEFDKTMESNDTKGFYMSEQLSKNVKMEDFVKYRERINAISKEDVMRVAGEYFGKNYLVSLLGYGFPTLEKIEKSNYKALTSNKSAKSEYAKYFEKIPKGKLNLKFTDFNRDVQTATLCKGDTLYYVQNPKNNIFSLSFIYGVGNSKHPMLNYAIKYILSANIKDLKASEFKAEFAKIGCNYAISSDIDYLTIYLSGLEENLEKALALLNKLNTDLVLDNEKLKTVNTKELVGRIFDEYEPDKISDALFEYSRFKNSSSYLTRAPYEDIDNINSDSLVKVFRKALDYEVKIHYVGKLGIDSVKHLIKNSYTLTENPIVSESPVLRTREMYGENTVFFVNKRRLAQSRIYVSVVGDPYDNSQDAQMDAFNLYFGGGETGLFAQEMRVSRSLAYDCGAEFYPNINGRKSIFVGFAYTQPEKTIEALCVFDTLIHNMPEKPERMDMVKEYLAQSVITQRPSFRYLSQTINYWKDRGYNQDPAAIKLPIINNMQFADIVKFYNDNIKNRSLVMTVVSNKKRFNIKELEKFGKVIVVKRKRLFKE